MPRTCTYCTARFTPSIAPDGQPEYLDYHGAVCCGTCLCGLCGHGHPTADEHDLCAGAFESGDVEAADPDLVRDIAQDALLGV